MFERFTHAARDAVIRAQAESRELHHPLIGTEHLLLALLRGDEQRGSGHLARLLAPQGVTADTVHDEIVRRVGRGASAVRDTAADDAALRAIGIDINAVRRAIEDSFGPGALDLPPAAAPKRRGLLRRVLPHHQPFSAKAKKSIELSLREALDLRHRELTEEHLLLGILREGTGLGAQILHEAGVDLHDLRAAVIAGLHHRAA
jgi:ATP-dependent Clp protease ATP-binding subunit ClpA